MVTVLAIALLAVAPLAPFCIDLYDHLAEPSRAEPSRAEPSQANCGVRDRTDTSFLHSATKPKQTAMMHLIRFSRSGEVRRQTRIQSGVGQRQFSAAVGHQIATD